MASSGLPIVGWSSATWHLLLRRPDEDEIPRTHRYREVTHGEFRVLSRNLDTYRRDGKVVVIDALSPVILARVTRLEVDQSGWKQGEKYQYNKVPKYLGGNDHVLVIYGTVDGMYIQYSYARADDVKFKEMVVTGVIEPKTVSTPEPSKLLVLAETVSKNMQRIKEALRLLDSAKENDNNNDDSNCSARNYLHLLIETFRRQNNEAIATTQVIPRSVNDLIAAVRKELDFLDYEIKSNKLLLEIDTNLNFDNDEREKLQRRVNAIDRNIRAHQSIIANIQDLKEYIFRFVSEQPGKS